jgi:sterol desaturase/sphingolipid hydroxylase (fatty acid hydroxylase superfamily)
MSAAFRLLQVSLIGLSGWAFAVYELVFQANTLFHHSNLGLPIRFERWLNKALVTPRMHGIHHSQVQRENNSNYGVVSPWWDLLHRTLGLNIPQAEIVIGIADYSLRNDNEVRNALLIPFRKQRDYWRRPDESVVERDAPESRQPPSYLAD